MGNWTTVNMIGKCNEEDVSALKQAITVNDDYENFHCLSNTGGLCGLNDWAEEQINAIGNLAERDYDADDIAEELKKLSEIAPSLNLVVHVGGDYESLDCIHTVKCKDGKVDILEPEVKQLMGIPKGQMEGNLLKAMMGK